MLRLPLLFRAHALAGQIVSEENLAPWVYFLCSLDFLPACLLPSGYRISSYPVRTLLTRFFEPVSSILDVGFRLRNKQ